MLRRLVLGAALLLAGCGPQFMAEALYPGGQVFAFRAAGDGRAMSYACAPEGPGGKTARDRAAAAHQYFDTSLERFSVKLADEMLTDIQASLSEAEFAAKVDRETWAFAETSGAEMEKRFACTFLGDRQA